MMKLRVFGVLLVFGVFFSCNTGDDGLDFQSTEIAFVDIGKGALFGNGEEGIVASNLTISNTSQWQQLMLQMDVVNSTSNNFTETNIDFNTFTVVAIFLEVKPNGWEIEVESVIENETNMSISTVETVSGVTLITQPFHIIKIPKTDKAIVVE